MKIFAFYVKAIQEEKRTSGIYIRIGTDGLDVKKKLIEEIKEFPSVNKETVEVIRDESMSLTELVTELKPEFEKLVKTAKIKSELLDAIGKLPVD